VCACRIDVTRKNANGLSALEVAKAKGRSDILDLFGGGSVESEEVDDAASTDASSQEGEKSKADSELAEEMGRLKNANKALRAKNDDLEAQAAKLASDVET
jgi:hypothetical protein